MGDVSHLASLQTRSHPCSEWPGACSSSRSCYTGDWGLHPAANLVIILIFQNTQSGIHREAGREPEWVLCTEITWRPCWLSWLSQQAGLGAESPPLEQASRRS